MFLLWGVKNISAMHSGIWPKTNRDFFTMWLSSMSATVVYERKVEAETIQLILDKLPEKYKAVLILCYMEDNSYQEIAEMLGVPIGTVMSRLSRAKQMMKKSLLRSTINEPQAKKVVQLNRMR